MMVDSTRSSSHRDFTSVSIDQDLCGELTAARNSQQIVCLSLA
jgi:hypothetical protein